MTPTAVLCTAIRLTQLLADVPAIVMSEAGRLGGGDFNFEFTSADDEDYAVNTALMAQIKSYTSPVIAIGADLLPARLILPLLYSGCNNKSFCNYVYTNYNGKTANN